MGFSLTFKHRGGIVGASTAQERAGDRADVVQRLDDLRLLGRHGIDGDLVLAGHQAGVTRGILSNHLEGILTISQWRVEPGKTPVTSSASDGCADFDIAPVNGDQGAGLGLADQRWRVVGGVPTIGDS
ncbi:hypothetical protein D3C84_902030 [compost metagenome]